MLNDNHSLYTEGGKLPLLYSPFDFYKSPEKNLKKYIFSNQHFFLIDVCK